MSESNFSTVLTGKGILNDAPMPTVHRTVYLQYEEALLFINHP